MTTYQVPSDATILKRFVVLLSTTANALKAAYSPGELITITVVNARNRVVRQDTYRTLSEVPAVLYSGPPPASPLWFAIVTLWVYGLGPTFLARSRVQTSAPKGNLVWNAAGAQNTHVIAKIRARLASSQTRRHSNWRQKAPLRPSPEVRTQPYPHYYETSTEGIRWNTLVTFVSYRRSWSGTRTPRFGALKARDLPVNSHSVLLERYWDDGCATQMNEVARKTFTLDPMHDQVQVLGGTQPGLAFHLPDAQVRALDKLKKASEVEVNNLAQDIFQVGQLERQLVTTVNRIAGSITALRHGYIHRAVNILWSGKAPKLRRGHKLSSFSSPSENWLEMQYGWKPLLQDLEGVSQSLVNMNLHDASVQSVSVTAKVKVKDQTVLSYPCSPRVPVGLQISKTESTCRYKIRFRVDSPVLAFFAQTGFTNPINLAWEVLPYSFVIDWFVPIGAFLEGLTSWQGLTFLSGCQTQFTRQTTFSDVNFLGPLAAPYPITSDGVRMLASQRGEVVRLDRTKLNSFPTNRPPSFKNPFSFTHSLNALALLQPAFFGHK